MALLQNVVQRGTHAARPAAGSAGVVYFETDTGQFFRDSGSVWQLIDLSTLIASKGDLLAGTGAGTIAKRGAGADGTVLTADSSQADGIKWAASAGALAKLDEKLLTSAAATIDFTGISGLYRNLYLTGTGRGDTSASFISVALRLNADTAANYDYARTWATNATPATSVTRSTATATIGYWPAATATSNYAGTLALWLFDYARTQWNKAWQSRMSILYASGSGGVETDLIDGFWNSTAAVNEVTLIPSAGNFATGTVVTLWGQG